MEGWHRRFNAIITAKHPTVWSLIDALKQEQGIVEMKVSQVIGGQVLSTQRKKYKDLNERILKIVQGFDGNNVLEYLSGIAQNLKF